MSPSPVVITDGVTTATFDPATGALCALTDGDGWNVVARPELGASFRLLIPLESRRNNVADGVDQAPPRVEATPTSVRFHWDRVRSRHGGVHEIGVVQEHVLADGTLTVRTAVSNRSEHTVENVFSPVLGDLRPPTPSGTLTAIRHDYGSGMRQPMWPRFEGTAGYYGVDVPTQLAQHVMPGYGAPVVPYTLIQSDDRGLFVGVAEPSAELVAWHAELWPGYADSLQSLAPLTDEIAGVPVWVRFGAVHVPYVLPGEDQRLTPIALRFYAGDWHAGADLYVRWRSSWLEPAPVPDWAREPHSWQQLQVNSPEDGLRLSFADLVAVGREAAQTGVRAIQLVGFNDGGQDRSNPSHEPDPRLGGYDALKAAIAQIQELGVKVVLFAKFTWADRSRDDFASRWLPEAVKDPYGDYSLHPGYRYETATQLLDINTRRLIPMCFLSESYLAECVRQFEILVGLGADGILFDECLHHMPTLLCFDTTHGHRYGAPTYANDRELVRRFRERLGDRPDFLFAGEAVYDWEFEAYGLSYHRSDRRDHFPLHRYTAARQQMMTAVTGFDDRNMINQSLLCRYVLSYEPYNFTGRLSDFPLTVEYGRRMDALRAEARAWVWDGTFADTVGATVTRADGTAAEPFSVFVADDGSRAVCVANYDADPVDVRVDVDGHAGGYRYRAIDDSRWTATDGRITLAPRSAAVVLPQGAVTAPPPDR